MAKELAWVLELQDKLSRNAKKIDRALDGLEKALEKAAATAAKLDKKIDALGNSSAKGLPKLKKWISPAEKFAKAQEKIAKQTDKANRALAKAKGKGKSGGGFIGSFLGNVGADIARGVADAIFNIGVSFGSAVFESRKFEESTRFAFRALLGGSDKADAAFQRAIDTAQELGASERGVLSSFNSLLPALDNNVDRVDEIVRSMGDLATLNPTANIEGVSRAISQIAATGRLQGDELLQLNEAGLATTLVYDELSKSLGKSKDKVKDLQAAGKITSKQGIDAILAAINNQAGGGEAGALAAEKAESTLPGQIGKIKNRGEAFIRTLDTDLSPLTSGFRKIAAFLDTGTQKGRKFQKLVEKIVEAAITLGGGLLDGFAKGLDKALPLLESMFGKMDDDSMANFAKAAEFAAIAIVAFGGTLAALGAAAGLAFEFLNEVGEKISEFQVQMFEAGSNLMAGLIEGLQSMAGAVVSAMLGPVDEGLAAIDSRLAINSPSKVMFDKGAFTGEGFVGGVSSKKLDALGAMTDLVSPPDVANDVGNNPAAIGAAAAQNIITNTTSNRSGGNTVHVAPILKERTNAELMQLVRREVEAVMQEAS